MGKMSNEKLDDRFKKRDLSRRDFIKFGLGGVAYFLYACKKNPTSSTNPVNYSGSFRGLIQGGSCGSGEITFNGVTKVPINNGGYIIDNSHNLFEGEYDVRIETNNCYPRECRVKLSNSGMKEKKSGYPLDNLIEMNAIDSAVYNNFISPNGSERWFSNKPKFFWYDKSLWHGTGDSIVMIDDNYKVDATTDSSVESVVNNHVGKYTDGWAGGDLRRESDYRRQCRASEMPGPFDTGWYVYVVQDNNPNDWAVSAYYTPDANGDIKNAGMSFNNKKSIEKVTVSVDTAQGLGIGQQGQPVNQIVTGSGPTDLAKLIGKIIHARAGYHNLHGGIDHYRA